MRVIAGKAKRIVLKTAQGLDTRPTTDRIKETLFNMINNRLVDCDFLDLFSGSGAIGIEAISRGAHHSIFVENNKNAITCIKENLHNTKLMDQATILNSEVLTAIRTLEISGKVFDVVFMDPPYNCQYEEQVLRLLQSSNIIYCDTLIIVEASIETDFSFIEDTNFQIVKMKEYKTNKHVFIELKNS
ncbi:MAG: 16S rRNA (guanine(966)-N(2))-methyltransferase RsmD [Anaerocolumna sp.]